MRLWAGSALDPRDYLFPHTEIRLLMVGILRPQSEGPSKEHRVSLHALSLPDVVTAAARDGFSRLLLGQLLFADGARFSHHVHHGLTPRLHHSTGGANYKVIVSSAQRQTMKDHATKPEYDQSGQ